jgi:hypothetical protein
VESATKFLGGRVAALDRSAWRQQEQAERLGIDLGERVVHDHSGPGPTATLRDNA